MTPERLEEIKKASREAARSLLKEYDQLEGSK